MTGLQIVGIITGVIGAVSGVAYLCDRRRVHAAHAGGRPTVCPVCGSPVPPSEGVCPVCGGKLPGAEGTSEGRAPSLLDEQSKAHERARDFADRLDKIAGKGR